jgi:hypothetical protein
VHRTVLVWAVIQDGHAPAQAHHAFADGVHRGPRIDGVCRARAQRGKSEE